MTVDAIRENSRECPREDAFQVLQLCSCRLGRRTMVDRLASMFPSRPVQVDATSGMWGYECHMLSRVSSHSTT